MLPPRASDWIENGTSGCSGPGTHRRLREFGEIFYRLVDKGGKRNISSRPNGHGVNAADFSDGRLCEKLALCRTTGICTFWY